MMKASRVAAESLMVLGGATAGAMVGLLCAPATGGRTRALLRDKFVHYSKLTGRAASAKSRHFRNMAQGMTHRASKLIPRPARPASS